jgi:hypothetical protein
MGSVPPRDSHCLNRSAAACGIPAAPVKDSTIGCALQHSGLTEMSPGRTHA